MDPDACRFEALALAAALTTPRADADPPAQAARAAALADRLIALDDFLCQSGHLPGAWRRGRHPADTRQAVPRPVPDEGR
ncbi:hypothetical protein GCM10027261_14170 [Geodermatophilus arenarius]|uniref:hypothetical protein n=1 Tax=Geodermatophilus arenarius TaxID=1137990 RepID=UPI0036DFA3E2